MSIFLSIMRLAALSIFLGAANLMIDGWPPGESGGGREGAGRVSGGGEDQGGDQGAQGEPCDHLGHRVVAQADPGPADQR